MHAGYLRLHTHNQNMKYVLQQWLHERFSVLRYTYNAGPVKFSQRCGLHSSGMTPRHWLVGSRCSETKCTGLIFNGLNVINGHYKRKMRPRNCPETSGTNYPATRRHPRRMESTRYCKTLYQGVYHEFYCLCACGAVSSGKNTASHPKLRYCLLWCSVLTASAAVVYKGYKTCCLLCKLCSQLVLSCWEC